MTVLVALLYRGDSSKRVWIISHNFEIFEKGFVNFKIQIHSSISYISVSNYIYEKGGTE